MTKKALFFRSANNQMIKSSQRAISTSSFTFELSDVSEIVVYPGIYGLFNALLILIGTPTTVGQFK